MIEITKSKVEEQTYFENNEGYEINNLLRHTIDESKKVYISVYIYISLLT